jgi:hypothetical protein
MNFVGRFALGFLMLFSACCPRYDRMTSDQLSELLNQCEDPSSPFKDPVIADLLDNKEAFDDPEFDAAAAREFAGSVNAKWNESLDEAESCLSRSAPADRTCDAFLACQAEFVKKKL